MSPLAGASASVLDEHTRDFYRHELWLEHSVPGRVLDMDVRLIPAEEMIWSKGLIMERERFDGADVAHVIHAVGDKLNWRRLILRYGQYWRALYAHLILFGFIYPS